MQMSGQVSRGSAGEYQADERAGVARLSWRVSGRWAGRYHAAQLASIRQMHSRTLAWEIPWTEESSRLQSTGSQGNGHDWATTPQQHTSSPSSHDWERAPQSLFRGISPLWCLVLESRVDWKKSHSRTCLRNSCRFEIYMNDAKSLKHHLASLGIIVCPQNVLSSCHSLYHSLELNFHRAHIVKRWFYKCSFEPRAGSVCRTLLSVSL